MEKFSQEILEYWKKRTEEYIPWLIKQFKLNKNNINSDDAYTRMMVSGGCVENNPILINALVELGLDVNKQYSNGDTPLHKAVVRGYIYSVKGLLDNGANPMIRNNQGNLPIDEIEYIAPGTNDNTKKQIIQLLKSAMASKRWKKLKAPIKMLSAYKRAVINTNLPERLKQLGLFDNPEKFDEYFKPAPAFGKKKKVSKQLIEINKLYSEVNNFFN
jgi:ankyrin repeat protein